jgi:flagellar basal-body rod modification protein FlgD
MALNSVVVENGKIVSDNTSGSYSTDKTSDESSGSTVDSDMFLKLLVAEMQYQDPLEPTSNTEWISQYATFTQVEQLESMASSYEQSEANQLVGKMVVVNSSNETGVENLVAGQVDYVQFENGETYLSIDDSLYPISSLQKVVDSDYMDAVTLSSAFTELVEELPDVKSLTTSDFETIQALRKSYDGMSTYEKSFLSQDTIDQFLLLETAMNNMTGNVSGSSSSTEDDAAAEDDASAEEVVLTPESTTVAEDSAEETAAAEAV